MNKWILVPVLLVSGAVLAPFLPYVLLGVVVYAIVRKLDRLKQ